MASLLDLCGLDWPVPGFRTLSRGQKTVEVTIPWHDSKGALHLRLRSQNPEQTTATQRIVPASRWKATVTGTAASMESKAKLNGLKLPGQRLFARDFDRQRAAVQIREPRRTASRTAASRSP